MRFSTLTVAALLTTAVTDVLPSQCQLVVTRTDTIRGNLFCPWVEYCYEVCVPNGCTQNITRFCVTFPPDLPATSLSFLSAPQGWFGSVVGTQICWSMGLGGVPIQQRDCATFCVGTPCWPDGILGIQNWQADHSNQGSYNGQTRAPIGAKAVLAANGPGNLGAQRVISVRDFRNPGGLCLVYCSPATAQATLPGFGEVLIDPVQAFELGLLAIDATGRGQTLVTVPPTPSLAGHVFYFQGLQVPDVHLSARLDYLVL